MGERGGEKEREARTEVLEEVEGDLEAIDELPSSEHLGLDTSQPRDSTRRQLEAIFAG